MLLVCGAIKTSRPVSVEEGVAGTSPVDALGAGALPVPVVASTAKVYRQAPRSGVDSHDLH